MNMLLSKDKISETDNWKGLRPVVQAVFLYNGINWSVVASLNHIIQHTGYSRRKYQNYLRNPLIYKLIIRHKKQQAKFSNRNQ